MTSTPTVTITHLTSDRWKGLCVQGFYKVTTREVQDGGIHGKSTYHKNLDEAVAVAKELRSKLTSVGN